MGDDFLGSIEFVYAPRQFSERDQVALQIADLKFVRLPNVKNEKIIATVKPGFQFSWRNFRNLQIRRGGFLSADATEFIVVNQLGDGWVLPANRAIGVL